MTLTETPHTWGAALDSYRAWLTAGGRRPGTIRLRTHYIEVLSREHPAGPWTITSADLIVFMARSDWSPETRRSARASLRRFYSWAVLLHHITESPADVLLPVLVPRRVQPVAPEPLIDEALSRASAQDRLMLLLGSRAGLRRAEIAGLAWTDIDWPTSSMLVTGKGGQQRIVPLSAVLEQDLRAEHQLRLRGRLGSGWRYIPDPSSPWIFPTYRDPGAHMSADTVGAIITRALKDAATPHGLRRRFATKAYSGEHDIRAVQELLGHASPETTARYIGVDRAQLSKAVNAAA